MKHLLCAFALIVVWFAGSQADARDPASKVAKKSSLQALFQQHCVKCHGRNGKKEGDVNLLAIRTDAALRSRSQLLQRLIRVLRDEEMPPEDEPPLADGKRKQALRTLNTLFRQSLQAQAYPHVPIRRMNRFQYNNAVVDLLGLDRDIFALNERLLRRRSGYFDPASGKMPDAVRITCRPLAKDIDSQRPEGFRGVGAFPQDKRAEHGFDNRADHLSMSPLLMESFLKLSQTLVESPDLNSRECGRWHELFVLTPSGARRFEAENTRRMQLVRPAKGVARPQEMTPFGKQWSGNSQMFWGCPEAKQKIAFKFAVEEPGEGLRIALTKAPDYGKFDVLLDDVKIAEGIDLYAGRVERAKEVAATVPVKAGKHTLTFICVGKNDRSPKYFFGLDYIDVSGEPQAKAAQDTPQKSPQNIVRARIKRLLRRAFRRPADTETLNRFTRFAERELAAGATFEQTMRTVVGAVLAMPEFLYLYDTQKHKQQKQPGKPSRNQPIDDYELATRLAQFFWSSIPDDRLLDLAEAGKLSRPKILAAQIDRMLNDHRSSRFCDNFPGQWLQLERLITSIPDPKKYPYFYYAGYRSSIHMMPEPLLLFETVFIEDRSVMELVDPKFTWESEMLRANYAGHSKANREVQVQLFRRVPVKDPRRGGVITNAAIMTMTSTPTRTQPITRGAWVNAVIFNDPPEPPPADVPPLPKANTARLAKLTIRERLALHRKRADCASCHRKIDPLGFALENYGPTGVWRDKYENGRDVDVSGVLFNRYKFDTLVEFKRLIRQEKPRFLRGFVAHLMSYALARQLAPADTPAIEAITAKAVAGEDRLRTILKNIAMSEPFLHKSPAAKRGSQ